MVKHLSEKDTKESLPCDGCKRAWFTRACILSHVDIETHPSTNIIVGKTFRNNVDMSASEFTQHHKSKQPDNQVAVERFAGIICGMACRSRVGLMSHLRRH